jgi:hypothetical protein
MFPNLVLLVIICGFWGVALSRLRSAGQKVSINLMILPVFFAIIGVSLNTYWKPWTGTAVVGAVHIVLLLLISLRGARHDG